MSLGLGNHFEDPGRKLGNGRGYHFENPRRKLGNRKNRLCSSDTVPPVGVAAGVDRRCHQDVAAFALDVDALGQGLGNLHTWIPEEDVPTATSANLLRRIWYRAVLG